MSAGGSSQSEMTPRTDTTVLWESGVHIVGSAGGDAAGRSGLISVGDFETISGWDLRPEGLCNGDACVPVRDRPALETEPGLIDVVVAAALLDRPAVADGAAGVMAVGASRQSRRQALVDRVAPGFTLPDLDGKPHTLAELQGKATVLVTFSSWCGCRYDLPGWQALADELADDGLSVVAVAFDQHADDVREFAEGVDIPVLLDSAHLLSELYAISNVPTVVWIDADGKVARPNTPAFGTDTFVDFHGVPAGPHLDAIRSWVRDGDVPAAPGNAAAAASGPAPSVADLSDDEVTARLLFRIGAHLVRQGRNEEAASRLARATELAPLDFTVARAAMPLTGRDPFGQEFMDLYDEWIAAGSPYHGLDPDEGRYRAG
jgi:peroxiredoxin